MLLERGKKSKSSLKVLAIIETLGYFIIKLSKMVRFKEL